MEPLVINVMKGVKNALAMLTVTAFPVKQDFTLKMDIELLHVVKTLRLLMAIVKVIPLMELVILLVPLALLIHLGAYHVLQLVLLQ